MSRLYSLAIAAFIISILVYGAIEWHNGEQPDTQTTELQSSPDFIAEQLTTNIYDQTGKLSHEISATRMEHYADLTLTHFEFPKYTLYPKNNSLPWQVSASEGTLNNNNRVILQNRVKLVATDKDSLIQEIQGKYLELDLNTNILSSNQTILIQGKDFTMYGSGLIVDLNTTQMTLTEHVQTIYKKTSS